jgi:hypothetical protein
LDMSKVGMSSDLKSRLLEAKKKYDESVPVKAIDSDSDSDLDSASVSHSRTKN